VFILTATVHYTNIWRVKQQAFLAPSIRVTIVTILIYTILDYLMRSGEYFGLKKSAPSKLGG
jgi:hypothetical protein